MKKTWEEPSIMVQQFMPNEYVAHVLQVRCSVRSRETVHTHVVMGRVPEIIVGEYTRELASGAVLQLLLTRKIMGFVQSLHPFLSLVEPNRL